MNNMKEVAKMLGVCINEKFDVVDNYGILIGEGYWIGVNGLKCGESKGDFNDTLCYLLNGSFKIVKKPWKPRIGKEYYMVNCEGEILKQVWGKEECDKLAYKIGNCFKSKDEITKDVIQKYVSWINSD